MRLAMHSHNHMRVQSVRRIRTLDLSEVVDVVCSIQRVMQT